MDIEAFLEKSLQDNGHALTALQQQKLLQYLELMEQWNRVYNLTAIKGPFDRITLHLLDSLAIGPYLQGTRIIDVGTGAGLPGIPLALTQPERSFVLLDSNHKKTAFLLHVIASLKCTNVEIVQQRVENFNPPTTFDSILTRAFSSLAVMLQVSGHLANEQSIFLAMKGKSSSEDWQNVPPGFEIVSVHPLTIVGLDAMRHLICVKKVKEGNSWEKQSQSSTKKAG